MNADRELWASLEGAVTEADDPRGDIMIASPGRPIRDKDVARYGLTQGDDGVISYEGHQPSEKPSTGPESLDLTPPGPGDGEPKEPEEPKGTELPDDFPGATELRAAGHVTTEDVAALSDDDLIQVPGIGQATIVKIKERLAA